MAIPVAIIGLGLTFAIMAVAAALVVTGRLSSRNALFLLAISVLGPGLVLGGLPDPAPAIQQIVSGVTHGKLNPVPIIGLAVLLLTSLLAGRLFCGYGCPLGAAQELLARLTRKKVRVNVKVARLFRLIVLLIVAVSGAFIVFYPGINPMAAFSLRPDMWQLGLFGGIAVAAVFVYRPWCTFLCPFGALADIASTVSPFRLRASAKCNDCGACDRICPAGQSVRQGSLANCYYCGRCIRACPKKAIYVAPGSRVAGDMVPVEKQPLNRQL